MNSSTMKSTQDATGKESEPKILTVTEKWMIQQDRKLRLQSKLVKICIELVFVTLTIDVLGFVFCFIFFSHK